MVEEVIQLSCAQVVVSGVSDTLTPLAVCQAVPTSSQFSVKVRAKPSDPFYSGIWSDWSSVLTGETPADIGELRAGPGHLKCICVTVV